MIAHLLFITLSDQPNDFLPIWPSSCLDQELTPNTPVGGFHEKGDLRKDFLHIWPIVSGLVGCRDTFRYCKSEISGEQFNITCNLVN